MAKAFKYLIIFVCVTVTVFGTPGPGEPPGLTGEKGDEGEAKKDEAHEDEATISEDASVTTSEDSAAGNVTAAAEPDPVNVTESIESIVLPEVGSAAKEHSSSLAIFFLLFILILSIFLIHLLLKVKFHYLPESLAMGKILVKEEYKSVK